MTTRNISGHCLWASSKIVRLVTVLVAFVACGAAFGQVPNPPADLQLGDSGGWPDATNTGVPKGATLTNSGSITTSSSGQVIQNLNITGLIHVKHDNVIIRNVRINGPFGRWAAISSDNNAKGAVIEDCEVNGNRTLGSYGIGIGGTVRRCKVWGVENGLTPQSNALYEDNYVYSLNPSGNDPHTDAVPIQGGPSNVTLRHNTFDTSGSTGFNATVFLNGYFGPMDNILFDNNRFIGIGKGSWGEQGYNIYSYTTPAWGSADKHSLSQQSNSAG